jgi:hypothetical protein
MSELKVLSDWYKPWPNNEIWRKIYAYDHDANGFLYDNFIELQADNMYTARLSEKNHYVAEPNGIVRSYQVIFRGRFRYMQELYEDAQIGKYLGFHKVEDIMKHVDDFMVRVDKLKAFI